jgi:hypothetical protein
MPGFRWFGDTNANHRRQAWRGKLSLTCFGERLVGLNYAMFARVAEEETRQVAEMRPCVLRPDGALVR